MKNIVLASSSPRRRQILKQVGLNFIVDPSNYDESQYVSENPHKLTKTHAKEKAEEVSLRHKNAIIIGADTVVFYKNEILEKPTSKTHAKKMLEKLSGTAHEVITGYSIIDTNTGKTITKSVSTKVYFKKLSEDEIDEYIDTKEPMDKAGAYAIQEKGALFVAKIKGDFFNAVGLPIVSVWEELKALKGDSF